MSRVEQTYAAQSALLGSCMLSDEAIETTRRLLEAEDFMGVTHQSIYRAILGVHRRGLVDPVTVAAFDPTLEIAELHALMTATPIISNAHEYARVVGQAAVARGMTFACAKIQDMAREGGPDLVERAHQEIDALRVPLGGVIVPGNVREFLDSVRTEPDWLFPNFLERGERLVITAVEGAGKSELMTQMAFMAAAGIHPWTWQSVKPIRTLFVDLENSPRLVAKRFRRLLTGCEMDESMLAVQSSPEGINVLDRSDRQLVFEWAIGHQADLIVIGPAYRLMRGVAAPNDSGGEQRAIEAQMIMDEWRARANVAVIVETHAPHGGSTGRRELRPIGSSAWLRWPEFGIGLRMDADNTDRYTIEHWRHARDDRIWPKAIVKNQSRWPWTPTGMPDGTFSATDPRATTATF